MFDVYQAVTDRIIAEMEKGRIPWNRPWKTNKAISHTTGKPYSLLNQFLLDERGGEYLTFQECQKEGGHVRKGEKASFVVFWKWIDKKDDEGKVIIGENGKPEQVPFLRYFNVFHISQCEGITPKYTRPEEATDEPAKPDEKAESIIDAYITREHINLVKRESNEAYYQPSTDTVVVPMLEQFSQSSEYYSTLFHELTHSTGHASRLDRLSKVAHFGSELYSKEELVAEIGAACLVNHCGMETESSFRNSAAYLQSWLSALRNDKKMIVTAAGKAEKAVNFILGA